MSNFLNSLGAIFSSANLGDYQYLKSIVDFLDMIIIPLTVTLSVAGAVFAVVIAFMIIKAESADRADEMKRRLLGLIITVITVTAVVWIFGLFLSNFSSIMKVIRGLGEGIAGSFRVIF